MMSSRLKERGGGGGKVMASRPQRCPPEATPTAKAPVRRAPSAGKENLRRTPAGGKDNSSGTTFNGKPAPQITRQRFLPGEPPRTEKATAEASSGVRWSTSSLPRGKASNSSDFSRILADLRAGDSGRGRVSRAPVAATADGKEKAKGRELKVVEGGEGGDLGTGRVAEKSQQLKKVAILRSSSNGKERRGGSSLGVPENKKANGVLLPHSVRTGSRAHPSTAKNVERGANRSDEVRRSSRIHDAYSDPKVNDGKESEYAKCLIDGSASRMSAYQEAGKRYKDEVVYMEVCKDSGNLVPNFSCIHDQTSKNDDALEDPKKSNNVKLNSKPLGVSSSSTNDTVDSNKVNSVAVILKSDSDSAVGESRNSDIYSDKLNKEAHNKEGIEMSLEGITVYENRSMEKYDKGKSTPVIGRNSSKLHEKLAFLEGKVQRIASDIKRTKEMLEQNNPDASKSILSDIQVRVSGIENAVCHVMGCNGIGLSSSVPTKDENLHILCLEKNAYGEINGPKNLVKELNHEELEARFFPHHRLLRSRASSSVSGERKSSSKKTIKNCDPMVEDGSLSPIDEDSIALEFLASLNADKSKANMQSKSIVYNSGTIQLMESENTSTGNQCVSKNLTREAQNVTFTLTSDENFEEFEDQENKPAILLRQGTDDSNMDQLIEIGVKPSTGGWFVSEGEAVLLAHGDGSCSYYDIANNEEKSEYCPPAGISNNLWGDCWLIRAPGVDGCSGKYVVAASAGHTLDSGFCSWDFYTKDVCVYRVEDGKSSLSTSFSSRAVLAPLPKSSLCRRSSSCTLPALGNQQWWYRPCGPLLVSASSRQNTISAYDIRDGEMVMTWDVQNIVTAMEFSSPLQWRSRGKLVIVESEGISLWDVNSINPRPLLSIASGKRITALHVNNSDAEMGGGVRQRISSSEIEGNDGVFCTQETINVMDLRLPSGVGLKISKLGCTSQSIFSRGDSVYLGCTETRSGSKGIQSSMLQQFSVCKGRLAASYLLPDNQAHTHHSSITQVWGNYNFVMGICGMGLFVFDSLKSDVMPSFIDHQNPMGVREIIGPNDLYCPSFDYLSSRVLVISRDRPATWRYML